MDNISVLCADVGSIKEKKFGWAASLPLTDETILGHDIDEFAGIVIQCFQANQKVALGFECPLFVPVRSDPFIVNSSRMGEGNRSWSAGAGTGALATGLVEVVWLMNRITERLGRSPRIEFNWANFVNSPGTIFLWEAFVTSSAKSNTHSKDAQIAVKKFKAALPNIEEANAISESNVLSLVGAAALRTGWSQDIRILAQPCIVIRG